MTILTLSTILLVGMFTISPVAGLVTLVDIQTTDDVKIYTKSNIVEFEDKEDFIEELHCDSGDQVITGYFKNIGDTRISYSSHSNAVVFEELDEETWRVEGEATSGAMTVEFTIFCAKVVPSTVIGGMLMPTDNISLALAYGYINAPWIALGMVGIGTGAYYLKTRKTS